MIKALVVDDNEPSRQYLCHLLDNLEEVELIGEAESGTKALSLAASLNPDVIFLDIDMPDMNGIEVAKKVLQEKPGIFIVFVTAYTDYATEAFEINSVDYLLKPFDEDRVRKSVLRVSERLSVKDRDIKRIVNALQKTRKLAIKQSVAILFINADEIYFIEKQKKKTVIYTRKGKYETNETISELEERLKNHPNFFRSHKCFLININLIESIAPWADRAYQVNFQNFEKEALISRSKFGIFNSNIGLG